MNAAPAPRFWNQVNRRQPNGHWAWTGRSDVNGPFTYIGGQPRDARKVLYSLIISPLSDDLDLVPECDEDNCVAPHHQRLVPLRETHCFHGHRYNARDTYVRSDGSKVCRICRRGQQRVKKDTAQAA